MDTEYTDKATIESYLLKTIDVSFDAQITEWIVAMSRQIDTTANRDIWRETPETFEYDGDGSNLLVIKDCHTITEVTVDGVAVSVFEYPVNKIHTSRIVLDGQKFTTGYQNVEVNAIHSMRVDLPEDIKNACTILVAGIVNDQILGVKKGATEKIGNYSVTYKNDEQNSDLKKAKKIINSYRRLSF